MKCVSSTKLGLVKTHHLLYPGCQYYNTTHALFFNKIRIKRKTTTLDYTPQDKSREIYREKPKFFFTVKFPSR